MPSRFLKDGGLFRCCSGQPCGHHTARTVPSRTQHPGQSILHSIVSPASPTPPLLSRRVPNLNPQV